MKLRPPSNDSKAVDHYISKLNYPLKSEVIALRNIIKNVNKDITEEVKWNAPSFSYKDYLVTFNLHLKDKILLVFHNGAILNNENGLMQGNYPDRRLIYFSNMKEINAKKTDLENLIKEWINLQDQK